MKNRQLRMGYRESAFSNGWKLINAGSTIDVFRLQVDDEEYRYLYIGYHDIGLDLDHTFLVLPHRSTIINLTSPELAVELLREWIEDHTDATEDEYREYLEEH